VSTPPFVEAMAILTAWRLAVAVNCWTVCLFCAPVPEDIEAESTVVPLIATLNFAQTGRSPAQFDEWRRTV